MGWLNDGHWRIRGSGEIEIELDRSPADHRAQEGSRRELEGLLYDFKYRDAEVRRTLLDVYARLTGLSEEIVHGRALDLSLGSSSAEAMGADLLQAVRSGRLVLRRVRSSAAVEIVNAEADVDDGYGPASEPVLTWIEIELVDSNGLPVPGAAYTVECADGSVRTGTTNSQGLARVEGVTEGQCHVSFPDVHGPHWAKS